MREELDRALAQAIRDPECPVQFSPLLMGVKRTLGKQCDEIAALRKEIERLGIALQASESLKHGYITENIRAADEIERLRAIEKAAQRFVREANESPRYVAIKTWATPAADPYIQLLAALGCQQQPKSTTMAQDIAAQIDGGVSQRDD